MKYLTKTILLIFFVLCGLGSLCQGHITKRFVTNQIVSNHPKRTLLAKTQDSNWIAIYNTQTKEIYQIDFCKHHDTVYRFLFAKGQLLRGISYIKSELRRRRPVIYSFDFYDGHFVGDSINVQKFHAEVMSDVLIAAKRIQMTVQRNLSASVKAQ